MKQSLAEIAEELETLLTKLDEQEGVLMEYEFQSLDKNYEHLEDKVDRWISWMDSIKANIDLYDTQAKRCLTSKRSNQNLLERLHGYIKWVQMQNPNVKLQGKLGKLSVQNSPKKLDVPLFKAHFDLVDQEVLEKWPALKLYAEKETITVINKDQLKEDLKAGMTIPGAELVQGQHVRLR